MPTAALILSNRKDDCSILTPASNSERLGFRGLEQQRGWISVDSSVTELLPDNLGLANGNSPATR